MAFFRPHGLDAGRGGPSEIRLLLFCGDRLQQLPLARRRGGSPRQERSVNGEEVPESVLRIEKTAQAILDARALFPESSLADLYDDTFVPPELRKAHQANDAAVLAAYGFDPEGQRVRDRLRSLQDAREAGGRCVTARGRVIGADVGGDTAS